MVRQLRGAPSGDQQRQQVLRNGKDHMRHERVGDHRPGVGQLAREDAAGLARHQDDETGQRSE